jgi:hypothetical protein
VGTVKRLIIVLIFVAPIASQAAQQWSSCQTVTGVSNYIAFGSQVIVALSPGLPCTVGNGIVGATAFTIGTFGVTSNNINTFLASSLSAYATGQKVMVYYDDAACGGLIISNGGFAGQCN